MDQLTMWKWRDSLVLTNPQIIMICLLSSFSVFQLVVLVNCLTLLFHSHHSYNIIFGCNSGKSSDKTIWYLSSTTQQLDPHSRILVEHSAAKEIFPSGVCADQKHLKESEYWTCIKREQLNKGLNIVPNGCWSEGGKQLKNFRVGPPTGRCRSAEGSPKVTPCAPVKSCHRCGGPSLLPALFSGKSLKLWNRKHPFSKHTNMF